MCEHIGEIIIAYLVFRFICISYWDYIYRDVDAYNNADINSDKPNQW